MKNSIFLLKFLWFFCNLLWFFKYLAKINLKKKKKTKQKAKTFVLGRRVLLRERLPRAYIAVLSAPGMPAREGALGAAALMPANLEEDQDDLLSWGSALQASFIWLISHSRKYGCLIYYERKTPLNIHSKSPAAVRQRLTLGSGTDLIHQVTS
jgi:hypothetical protein